MKSNYITMTAAAYPVLRAGFTGESAITALAVCWAESGGNTLAVNINVSNPLSPSYRSLDLGLCQFNTYWNPGFTIPEALDPDRSLVRMHALYEHYGFRLWTSYNNGRYKPYLASATYAIDSAVASSGGNLP
jgi:Lysozyme like domain